MTKLKNLFNKQNIKTLDPFVIAEIGHNHKGSLEIAKELFFSAKSCGADAVKLQKRSNVDLYTNDFYNRIYESENSYGKTYGQHREYLEFGKKEYKDLIKYAKKIDLEFLCTPFDFVSLIFLEELKQEQRKVQKAIKKCKVNTVLIDTVLEKYTTNINTKNDLDLLE